MTIAEVLAAHSVDTETEWGAALLAALINREDAKCDLLRLAGAQFGLYPAIVAEVLAEVGLGEPISDEQRILIRNQFNTLMAQLREQQQGNDN
jgi:hypothetical protein